MFLKKLYEKTVGFAGFQNRATSVLHVTHTVRDGSSHLVRSKRSQIKFFYDIDQVPIK